MLLGTARAARAQDTAPPPEDTRGGGHGSNASGRASDTRRLTLSGQAGGSWSTGNTQSLIANAALRATLLLGHDQLTFSALVSYSAATTQPSGAPPDAPAQHYVADSNFYARLRYDRYFLERNSVFVGTLFFRDVSSGFRARIAPYAGYLRELAADANGSAVWVEGGYRPAYEALELDTAARAAGFGEQRWVHSAVGFVGGRLSLSETLDLDGGLEGMFDMTNPSDARLFGILNGLLRVHDAFWAGLSFNLRYMAEPIGDRAPLDTSLQLVLLLNHEMPLGGSRDASHARTRAPRVLGRSL